MSATDELDGDYTYDEIKEMVKFLKTKTTADPKIGIICGSGMGAMLSDVEGRVEVKYEEIPKFPISTVEGHEPILLFGKISSVPIVALLGRFHFYEGFPLKTTIMPVRLFKLLGCTHLIVTNASGGINQNYQNGDIVILRDQINFIGFAGTNALRGPNDEKWGDRFPSMNNAYDVDIARFAKKCAREELGWGKRVHTGVYGCVAGPTFETVAETRLFVTCGIDVIGMSTVPEVIVARHCGLKVFGLSLVTDMSRVDFDDLSEPNHEEVLKVVDEAIESLKELLKKVVDFMGTKRPCKCIPLKK